MVAVRNRLWAIVCEEVKIELGVRVWQLIDQLHAQELIKFQTALGILDAKHRVVELVAAWIGSHCC